MKRRAFLITASAACASGLAAGCTSRSALAPAPTTKRWGLQLFTVGALLEADFEGTLRKIAELGYSEVETVGSFGREPARLRGLLDKFGLVSPSQHISPDALYASFGAWTRREITTEQNRANYESAFAPANVLGAVRDGVAKAKVLGQSHVTWPTMQPQMLANRTVLDQYIGLFGEAGRICREEGLTFAFHNHAREFEKLGGDVIYDLMLAGTDPALVKMEMDLYWIAKAKRDPLPYFAANPGRFFACHVKDMDSAGDFAPPGSGTLNLPPMIDAARASGAKNFFVEIDRSNDPMAAITSGISYLKRAG